MKKTYIIPEIEVCEVEAKNIIALSMNMSEETVNASQSLADEWRINLDGTWWDE